MGKFVKFCGFDSMPVETTIRSIFDTCLAGQIEKGTEGYYCIYMDHKTKSFYALAKEDAIRVMNSGRMLETNEAAEFFGEKVRGMTFEEELLFNQDELDAKVDLWSNVAVEDEKEQDLEEKDVSLF